MYCPPHIHPPARSRAAGGLLLLIVFAGACHEARPGVEQRLADGEELHILRQVARAHSHEPQAMKVVVRDPATLARIPLADVPVDFAREMVLIVTLGRVPSDRYGVRIERVWRQGGRLRVQTRVLRPPPGAPVVMASPFCVAVVPRCDLTVAGFAPEPPPRDRTWGQSEWQSDPWSGRTRRRR